MGQRLSVAWMKCLYIIYHPSFEKSRKQGDFFPV
nr:MAG TPA: hypothetical protein [Caudoviricetes sp.]